MQNTNQEVFISNELLRESTNDELGLLIIEQEERLFEIRSAASLGGRKPVIKKPHIARACKNLIARAKTILRERQ